MCGIAGLVKAGTQVERYIDPMTDALAHRGPDDRGTKVFPQAGVALGMRRLSILDLEFGRQPMSDSTGRYTVVFNGEIYNHHELRRELIDCGSRFTTHHSDTEVLLNGFAVWGASLLPRLNGMFAFAIWDALEGSLFFARDRMGKKPLFLASTADGGLAFASEMKSLLRLPWVSRGVDPIALTQYLAYDWSVGPRTLVEGIEKFPAGWMASWTRPGGLKATPFWAPTLQTVATSPQDAGEQLDDLLDASVQRRMLADVPVGVFLSGGLDSSTVAYYMTRHSSKVSSFSIGFDEPAYDESRYAREVARFLGTEHHERRFATADLVDLVPRLPQVLDEPMADQSILPTLLLSEFAAGEVKVSLGGDGSDELFLGYNLLWPLFASSSRALPGFARSTIAAVAQRLPRGSRLLRPSISTLARNLNASDSDRLLALLGSFNEDPGRVLRRNASSSWRFTPEEGAASPGLTAPGAPERGLTLTYLRGYLQEDILVKVDRASMAASLEVRAPFLDPTIVDFALSLPLALKRRGRTGKVLLRQLMRSRLPDSVFSRRKQGFGAPVSNWLRGPLRASAADLLSPARLTEQGLFREREIAWMFDRHLTGKADFGRQLWAILLFQLWWQAFDIQLGGSADPPPRPVLDEVIRRSHP